MEQRPWSEPKIHRTGIVAADSADPVSVSDGIDTAGYERARFDVALNSGTPAYPVEFQVLFWNRRQGKYFRGAGIQIAEFPKAIEVACRGAVVFLKVTRLSGAGPAISIDCALS